MVDLSDAQERILRIAVMCDAVIVNGHSRAPVERLAKLGLVTYTISPSPTSAKLQWRPGGHRVEVCVTEKGKQCARKLPRWYTAGSKINSDRHERRKKMREHLKK